MNKVYVLSLFSNHPEVAEAYGADGIDPDRIGNSQRFVLLAQSELQYFIQLPKTFEQEREWRSSLSYFKEHFCDIEASLQFFNVCFYVFLLF